MSKGQFRHVKSSCRAQQRAGCAHLFTKTVVIIDICHNFYVNFVYVLEV